MCESAVTFDELALRLVVDRDMGRGHILDLVCVEYGIPGAYVGGFRRTANGALDYTPCPLRCPAEVFSVATSLIPHRS